MADARCGVLLAVDQAMKRLQLFGSVALALVVGCSSKAQTPDGGGGTAGTMDAGPDIALPPAMGTPGVWENVTSP